MRFLTWTNILRLFVVLIFILLIVSFFGFRSANIPKHSNLSFRSVHKYAHVHNWTAADRLPSAPLALSKKKNSIRNSTVIKNWTSNTKDLNKTVIKDFAKSKSLLDVLKPHKLTDFKPAKLRPCSELNRIFSGPIRPNLTVIPLDAIDEELGPLLQPGGAFEPEDCIPRDHVAVVLPFRDRYAHLPVFIRNIHPFLMKQRIAYRIYVVEQTNGKPFNRASLMNVGFLEALKMYKWDCFIFHDIDLLPLDDRNIYNCPRQPRHMSAAIDVLDFKLPYPSIFGGASALTRQQFEIVNGFSNSFYGWGGEDDDMSNRLKHEHFYISRYPINIARYTMLRHQKEKANPKRYETLNNGVAKMDVDGLNSIQYNVYGIKEFPTFTWILVDLKDKR